MHGGNKYGIKQLLYFPPKNYKDVPKLQKRLVRENQAAKKKPNANKHDDENKHAMNLPLL